MPKVKNGLNLKQAAFVREYLVDLNSAQAARRAGYAAHSASKIGSENIAKPAIAKAIAEAMAARSARTEITQDRVLQELARVAFFDPRRLLNPDGSPKPVNELDDDTAAVLSGMDILEEFAGTGKDRKLIGYTKKVKVSDKVAALGLAMRHLGMLRDKIEHTGADGTPLIPKLTDLTDDELAAIASGRSRSR